MSGEGGHHHRLVARYRSPGKDRQIANFEWIQSIIALEKIFYLYTLREVSMYLARCLSPGKKVSLLGVNQGAKFSYFMFASLFSIFGFVSIHTYQGAFFPGQR